MKNTAKIVTSAVRASADTAANLPERYQQKAVLNTMRDVLFEMKTLLQTSRALNANSEDPNLAKLLQQSSSNVTTQLDRLLKICQGIFSDQMERTMIPKGADMENLAEKELLGAATAIEKCIKKIMEAKSNAARRAETQDISIDEQNITEAILEAAKAIAESTQVLVRAATGVQQEFQKLATAPQTQNLYKRDPQWAEGLISASKTVAGAVQHLVTASNQAAQGSSTEEALIVAAKAVSAATTQLVTASTVKTNVSPDAQRRLKDASGRVTGATQALVEAAKNAAKWAEEKEAEDAENKYALSGNKIKEMEKQMEILRLEKELEKARKAMHQTRKDDYAQNTTQAKPAPGGGAKASPTTPARGTPATPSRPVNTSGGQHQSNQNQNPSYDPNSYYQQDQQGYYDEYGQYHYYNTNQWQTTQWQQ